jgi:hypothetical protein
VLRRLGQLLLLSVATLAGCTFDTVPIGPPADDAGVRPRTEDEVLKMFGLELAGSWRGLADMQTLLFDQRVYLLLVWTPDLNQPRSGQLSISCVQGAADCTPTGTGVLQFTYNLYEVTDQGSVKGALELYEDEEGMTALGTLELTPKGAELSLYAAGPPPFLFASLAGNFMKEPPPVPDAGASSPGPSP